MNNKLKIYARETKEGKEIHQTQIISISSSNLKRSDSYNQHPDYKSPAYQSTLKGSKHVNTLEQKKFDQKYSFVKQKAAPKRSKDLNKSVNLICLGTKLTLKSKSNANIERVQSKTPMRKRTLSKEKIEASIDLIIKLKAIISKLNSQIDLNIDKQNTIVTLGEGAIEQLIRKKIKLQETLKQNKADSILLYKEEKAKIEKAKESIALIKNKIKETEDRKNTLNNNYLLQKNKFGNIYQVLICPTKFGYVKAIEELETKITELNTQQQCLEKKNNNIQHNDSQAYKQDLLSQEEVKEISFLLKILCSVYSINKESLLNNTFAEETNHTKITIDLICDNILSLTDSINDFNKEIIIKFFKTFISKTLSCKTINIDILRLHFSSLIGTINNFASNTEGLNCALSKIWGKDRETLSTSCKQKDSSITGLITLNQFKEIVSNFNQNKLDDNLFEYMVYLMKKETNTDWKITELNYMTLLNAITVPNEPSIKQIDVNKLIGLLTDYIRKENITMEDFLSPFEYLMLKTDDVEYLDTKLFSSFLKSKQVINENEVLVPDKEIYHDMTNIKALVSNKFNNKI